MRPDELYLRDLLAAAEAIERFLVGVTEEIFLGDELLQSAVLQKLTVIGEAVARVSAEVRDAHPEIEWRTVVGLRNVVVHEYFAVSWEDDLVDGATRRAALRGGGGVRRSGQRSRA